VTRAISVPRARWVRRETWAFKDPKALPDRGVRLASPECKVLQALLAREERPALKARQEWQGPRERPEWRAPPARKVILELRVRLAQPAHEAKQDPKDRPGLRVRRAHKARPDLLERRVTPEPRDLKGPRVNGDRKGRPAQPPRHRQEPERAQLGYPAESKLPESTNGVGANPKQYTVAGWVADQHS
jgi:hypothetical protein